MAPTELAQIGLDVVEIVTCLFRLSMTMRKPAAHERFLNSGSADTTFYFRFDESHISAKFPAAETFLCSRLGKANSQRRQFFKYRKSHHEKLAQILLSEHQETGTVASSIPSDLKDDAIEAAASRVYEQDQISNSGVSRTSYATSHGGSDRIRVPPLPKTLDGIEGECPYCWTVISVRNRNSWK